MSKAHVYKRDHINTDEIIPARYLNTDDEMELAGHCLEDLDKDFVKKVKEGDSIVAGEDFGCGSSREHAVWALRGAGVKTVIAKTFARIFYRNAINEALPVIVCPEAVEHVFQNHPKGEVGFDKRRITINFRTGDIVVADKIFSFPALNSQAMKIFEAGGLIEYTRQRLREEKS